jgi:hypothetical protein
VNSKPPVLPDIEDATLRACLAPLMDMVSAGTVLPAANGHVARPRVVSNDNPPPSPAIVRDTSARVGESLAPTGDDSGTFRMVEMFLAMTDQERRGAVSEFPRQIAGTITRIVELRRRLADQYDAVTTALVLLRRATASGVEIKNPLE